MDEGHIRRKTEEIMEAYAALARSGFTVSISDFLAVRREAFRETTEDSYPVFWPVNAGGTETVHPSGATNRAFQESTALTPPRNAVTEGVPPADGTETPPGRAGHPANEPGVSAWETLEGYPPVSGTPAGVPAEPVQKSDFEILRGIADEWN